MAAVLASSFSPSFSPAVSVVLVGVSLRGLIPVLSLPLVGVGHGLGCRIPIRVIFRLGRLLRLSCRCPPLLPVDVAVGPGGVMLVVDSCCCSGVG